MFKPYPMLQFPGPAKTVNYLSVGHITNIVTTGKKTSIYTFNAGVVTTEMPLDQVVSHVRQAGGILLECQNRSKQTNYVMARHIARVEADRKGMATIHFTGSGSSSAVITTTPVETILQQLQTLAQQQLAADTDC